MPFRPWEDTESRLPLRTRPFEKAQMHFCSDAEVGQDRVAVLTDRVPCLKAIVWFCYTFEVIVEEGKAISKKGKRDDEARWFFAWCFAMC